MRKSKEIREFMLSCDEVDSDFAFFCQCLLEEITELEDRLKVLENVNETYANYIASLHE